MEGQGEHLGGCSHVPMRGDNSLSPGSEVRGNERGVDLIDQAGPGDHVD